MNRCHISILVHHPQKAISSDNDSYWKSPIVAGAGHQNRLACEKDGAWECCRMMWDVKRRQNAKLLPNEDRR